MMHVRSKDLPGGYVLNHSPYRDGFVASEPLAFPGEGPRGWQRGFGAGPAVAGDVFDVLDAAAGGAPGPGRSRFAVVEGVELQQWRSTCRGGGTLTVKLYEQLKVKSEKLKRNENLLPRDRIDQLLNDPTSSTPAMIIGILMLVLIVISTFTFVLETAPWFYREDPPLDGPFFIIESDLRVHLHDRVRSEARGLQGQEDVLEQLPERDRFHRHPPLLAGPDRARRGHPGPVRVEGDEARASVSVAEDVAG